MVGKHILLTHMVICGNKPYPSKQKEAIVNNAEQWLACAL